MTETASNSSPAPGEEADRRAPWRDPVVIVALVLWLGTLLTLRAMHHANTVPLGSIAASDRLARPGEEIELVARVALLRADGSVVREGIPVSLRLTSEPDDAGHLESGPDGMVTRRVTAPAKPGSSRYEIELRSSHVLAAKRRIDPRLQVVSPAKPLVVVDLDGTLCPPDEKIPEVIPTGVDIALRAMCERHTLVLLSASSPDRADALRSAFLKFPLATIVTAGRAEETAEESRARVLADWTERFGAPARAIAGSASAVGTFTAAGIPTLALGVAPSEGATAVDDWEAVRAAFTTPAAQD